MRTIAILPASVKLLVHRIATSTIAVGFATLLTASTQAQLIMEEPWDGRGNPWHGFRGDINFVPSHYMNRTSETHGAILVEPKADERGSESLFEPAHGEPDPAVKASSILDVFRTLQEKASALRKLHDAEAQLRLRNRQSEERLKSNSIPRVSNPQHVTPIGVPYSVEEAMMSDVFDAPAVRQ